ncbi:MAG: hypothetical protein II625_04345 [Bacilli bacterium]|nr:hypothetical protein [Bacilli bacterium]
MNNLLEESIIRIVNPDAKEEVRSIILDNLDKYNMIYQYDKNTNMEEMANQLHQLHMGMMKFYGEIEKKTHTKKTTFNILLIIKDIDEIYDSDKCDSANYKYLDSIKGSMGSLARLGKSAGIQIIYTTTSSDFKSEIVDNTTKTI